MLNTSKNIRSYGPSPEGIDFSKLKIVLHRNWLWLVLIFIVVNASAYLYIRYTKNIYESESELKLDLKDDATALGIKTVVEDQNVNVVSGEIEIIQSKLFLNRVLDSSTLDVSYYSVGRVLNEELFSSTPFTVRYTIKDNRFYNTPIFFREKDNRSFSLRVGENGSWVDGKYEENLSMDGLDVVLRRNNRFTRGDEVGYFFTINSRDVLLDYLLRNLTAEPLNYNANTIRVSFKDNNPFKAQAILNRINSIYLQYSNEQKNLANRQKIEWLSNELEQIEGKMEGFENYFEDFTLQNKTSDLTADLNKTIARINRIDSQRYDLTQKISRLDDLIKGLTTGRDFIVSLSQRQFLPEQLNRNLDVLQELLLDQEKLKMSYSEITFAYRQNEKEIETLRNKSIAQLTDIRTEWLKRLGELNQHKTRLENDFANLPDKNTQFSKNLRFYKLNEQFYLTLMQSKSEFEIAQAGSTPDFKILSPATLPHAPISPKKTLIAGAGFVASFVFIIFFIGISYLLNNKITSLPELDRAVDVPVLGVVPTSRHTSESGLHIVDYPKSMVSEAIRTLRTNLDFFNIQSATRVIAISSTVSGEGKSFIALNLGAVIALSKKKVILLDLDMRKPKTNIPFAPDDRTKGMSTVLIRKNTWQECVVRTPLETFDYIPSGPHPPNPSELLLNGEFEGVLHDLKKNYDYIILDTPPVGLVTDGIMAMKRADISIYIFRANYSKRNFVSNLQRITDINKFTNMTMLLNALPSTEKSYGYGYYEEPGSTHWLKNIFKR